MYLIRPVMVRASELKTSDLTSRWRHGCDWAALANVSTSDLWRIASKRRTWPAEDVANDLNEESSESKTDGW